MSATAAKESPFQTLKEMEKPEPKALAELLESVRSFLCRYIAFPTDAHATAISLWIVHTWAIEAFDYTPYLSITSPVKRCGKSRLLDCLRALCRKAWAVISPTEAVLYRKIEADCPTLLLDEVDTIYTGGKGDDSKEGLRALLNAGFERRATVPRCVGPKHDLQEFRVFCPKALAGIGKLPDTVADRSLPVIQARRAKGQNVQRFRARDALPIAQPIMEALQSWSETPDVIATLSSARPAIPNELGDRASDTCEPLLAIADNHFQQGPETLPLVLRRGREASGHIPLPLAHHVIATQQPPALRRREFAHGARASRRTPAGGEQHARIEEEFHSPARNFRMSSSSSSIHAWSCSGENRRGSGNGAPSARN